MPRSDTLIKNNIDQFEKEHGQIEVDQTIEGKENKAFLLFYLKLK